MVEAIGSAPIKNAVQVHCEYLAQPPITYKTSFLQLYLVIKYKLVAYYIPDDTATSSSTIGR